MDTQKKIKEACQEISDLLCMKNEAYGDSAISPIGVFGHSDPLKALGCRIDDKISRIKNRGMGDHTEDTLDDLIGYLVLYKIAYKMERTPPPPF
jgi:hypothetical protein